MAFPVLMPGRFRISPMHLNVLIHNHFLIRMPLGTLLRRGRGRCNRSHRAALHLLVTGLRGLRGTALPLHHRRGLWDGLSRR